MDRGRVMKARVDDMKSCPCHAKIFAKSIHFRL